MADAFAMWLATRAAAFGHASAKACPVLVVGIPGAQTGHNFRNPKKEKLHFLLESTFSIRADFCGFCGSIGKCMPLRGPVALDVPSESGSGEGSDSLLQAVPASGVDPPDRGSLGSAWEPAPSLPHAHVIGLISAIFLPPFKGSLPKTFGNTAKQNPDLGSCAIQVTMRRRPSTVDRRQSNHRDDRRGFAAASQGELC